MREEPKGAVGGIPTAGGRGSQDGLTYQEYGWQNEAATHMHQHFMPKVFDLCGPLKPGTRVLDVGCGNGFLAGEFAKRGCDVTGIDLSEQGIAIARKTFPGVRFEVLAADLGLLESLQADPFDIVVSTEVIEHLYNPRSYVRGCYAALRPGGRFVCSTPYHGYLKNLAIAIGGAWDRHANPLWDGGHIKLWSRVTLTKLLSDAAFVNFQFRGAGRLPYLWMTMLVSGDRPAA